MKKVITLLAACFVLASFVPQAAAGPRKPSPNKPETRGYDISGNYSKVRVESTFEVIVSDTVSQAMVTIKSSAHENVSVTVEDGVLRIALTGRPKLKERPQAIIPPNAHLQEIFVTGASSFSTPYTISADEVKVDVGDASKFCGNLAAKKVVIDLSGASRFEGSVETGKIDYVSRGASTALITGSAFVQMLLDMTEASDLDGKNFEAKRIKGSMDGASSALINCSHSLRVDVRDASTLIYGGDPREIDCPFQAPAVVRHR